MRIVGCSCMRCSCTAVQTGQWIIKLLGSKLAKAGPTQWWCGFPASWFQDVSSTTRFVFVPSSLPIAIPSLVVVEIVSCFFLLGAGIGQNVRNEHWKYMKLSWWNMTILCSNVGRINLKRRNQWFDGDMSSSHIFTIRQVFGTCFDQGRTTILLWFIIWFTTEYHHESAKIVAVQGL